MTAPRPAQAANGRDRIPRPIRPRPLHQPRTTPPKLRCRLRSMRVAPVPMRNLPPQHVADRRARPRHRFKYVGIVGPRKAPAVAAATPEELFVAAAGERKVVAERLIEIAFEDVAPDQHIPGPVDHRHPAGGIADRRENAASRQPVSGIFEDRKHRTADDVGVVSPAPRQPCSRASAGRDIRRRRERRCSAAPASHGRRARRRDCRRRSGRGAARPRRLSGKRNDPQAPPRHRLRHARPRRCRRR